MTGLATFVPIPRPCDATRLQVIVQIDKCVHDHALQTGQFSKPCAGPPAPYARPGADHGWRKSETSLKHSITIHL
jgi:hypothetical protein